MQIIDRLDTTRGEVPGAKGDQQFRIYRPGVPSIEVSATNDKADVDVDYRSSGFPNGLVNGHLTNSTTHLGFVGDGASGAWVAADTPSAAARQSQNPTST